MKHLQIFFFTAGIAACAGLGNGLISSSYSDAGTVNGIVSMMGGLGGSAPSLVIAAMTSVFGTNKLAFFFLVLFGIIALLTMMWMDKKEQRT